MAQHELARFETISSSFLVDFLATRGAGLGLFLFLSIFFFFFFEIGCLLKIRVVVCIGPDSTDPNFLR